MIAEQSANVVVVPVGAQVGQLNQLWLYKQEILAEDCQGLFTPVAVQATDHDLEVLFLPNRLQLVGKRPVFPEALALAAERAARLVNAAGGAILGALSGVGFNVQLFWSLQGHPHSADLLERVFVREGALDQLDKSRQVGLSVSEQLEGWKLTTKFDHANNIGTGEMGLSMGINAHSDLQDVTDAVAFLGRAQEFSALLQGRIDQFEKEVIGAVL